MRELIFNPPIILLLLSISLAYFFVLFHYSNNRKVAERLEIFAIFVFLLSLAGVTIPPFSQLTPDALAGLDKTLGSAIAQLSVYAFVVIILRFRFQNFFQNSLLILKDPFMAVLLVLTLLSAFWSETPGLTFKYSLALVGTSLFAVHLGSQHSLQRLTTLLRWMCAFVAIASMIISIAVPSIGVNFKGWQGVTPFPISLGLCMDLGITLWYCYSSYYQRQKQLCYGIILISLFVLIRTNSVQAIFVLITLAGIIAAQKFFRKLEFKQALSLVIFLTVIGLPTAILVSHNLDSIFAAFGKDPTLTGRTEFWPQLVETLNHHNPLLGYGVHGFWQPWRSTENPARHIINPNGFVPPHAHNGFLDMAMEMGWLGLILFFGSFFINFGKAFVFAIHDKSCEAITPLLFFAYLIMANISDTQLFLPSYVWFVYILLSTRLRLGYGLKNSG